MHHSNTEWFWNSATNNHLAMTVPNHILMHRSSELSSNNAIIADVGICFGMRNVDLNLESTCVIKNISHRCKYSAPRPSLPWYENYAQYLQRSDTFSKFHQTPLLVSNGLNALVVNEYSSANMRDEILKFGQSMSTTHCVNHIRDLSHTGHNEFIPSTPNSIIKDEKSDPPLTPPKKKWIRHYMMGE